MYKIAIILLLVFGSLYAKSTETSPLVTAELLSTAYAKYKIAREGKVEVKILKPRVLNFANYLYRGIVEMDMPHKEKALAYGAVLSLLSQKGGDISLPDGYEHLQGMIIKEIELIMDAKETTLSPIMNLSIDYSVFKVPKRYKDLPRYYRSMKFTQILPLEVKVDQNSTITVATQIEDTIKASQRLSNLYNAIYEILHQYVGVTRTNIEKTNLFARSKSTIEEDILSLNSSLAYDRKIVEVLKEAGYSSASKAYEKQTKYRMNLYSTTFEQETEKEQEKDSKENIVPKNLKVQIEANLIKTLDLMIENTLSFALTIHNNTRDLEMVEMLKTLRTIAKKEFAKIKLDESEKDFVSKARLLLSK